MVMPERAYNAGKYRWGFNGKETDNEVKGAGNSLDFGARLYDSRLGRWSSVDPQSHNYPHFSAYCAFENNPVYFGDNTGEAADFVIHKNAILISCVIKISGDGATQAKAADMQRQIMDKWGGSFKYKGTDGKSYNMKFNITVEVQNNSILTTSDKNDPNSTTNYVDLKSDGAMKDRYGDSRSYVKGGRTGVWSKGGGTRTYSHETGHFLGLDDRYYDNYIGGPGTGIPNTVISTDFKATALDDIMGTASGNKEGGIVKQVHIDAIGKYIEGQLATGKTGKINGMVTGKLLIPQPNLAGYPKSQAIDEGQQPPPLGTDESTKH